LREAVERLQLLEKSSTRHRGGRPIRLVELRGLGNEFKGIGIVRASCGHSGQSYLVWTPGTARMSRSRYWALNVNVSEAVTLAWYQGLKSLSLRIWSRTVKGKVCVPRRASLSNSPVPALKTRAPRSPITWILNATALAPKMAWNEAVSAVPSRATRMRTL